MEILQAFGFGICILVLLDIITTKVIEHLEGK